MRVPTALEQARPVARARRGAILLWGGYQALAGRGTGFTHQPLGTHVDPGALRGYYLDLRYKGRAAAQHPDGFPRRWSDGARVNWAVPVAQAALGFWDLHLEGEPTEERFLALADWLVERSQEESGGRVWRAPQPVAKYRLGAGWPSALGQSQGISVLLRAHALSGREAYLEIAHASFEPMTRAVESGGVARRLDGRLVLEEYPSVNPCAVLNGWAAALLGLHELALATADQRVQDTFDESYAGLLELLPRYDVGWWTLYSLYPHGRPDLAKPNYQRLHPVMLDALNLVRPDPRLPAMARRWEGQLSRTGLARNAANKLAFRLYRELRPEPA